MPLPITTFTLERVYDSLFSMTCPACGSRKKEERSLCYSCFKSLPVFIQNDLYLRIGSGYEQALAAALNHLQADRFHEHREIPTD